MSLLTALFFKNSHILAGIYFIFLKLHTRPNLKILYKNWISVKRSEKALELPKLSIKNKFEEAWGKLKARTCFERQSWAKYLRQTQVQEFQEFFASIDKIFILRGRLGTRLQFYEVLKFS